MDLIQFIFFTYIFNLKLPFHWDNQQSVFSKTNIEDLPSFCFENGLRENGHGLRV